MFLQIFGAKQEQMKLENFQDWTRCMARQALLPSGRLIWVRGSYFLWERRTAQSKTRAERGQQNWQIQRLFVVWRGYCSSGRVAWSVVERNVNWHLIGSWNSDWGSWKRTGKRRKKKGAYITRSVCHLLVWKCGGYANRCTDCFLVWYFWHHMRPFFADTNLLDCSLPKWKSETYLFGASRTWEHWSYHLQPPVWGDLYTQGCCMCRKQRFPNTNIDNSLLWLSLYCTRHGLVNCQWYTIDSIWMVKDCTLWVHEAVNITISLDFSIYSGVVVIIIIITSFFYSIS